MLLIQSSSDQMCYVETKNLDGETNLKNKVVPSGLTTEMFSEISTRAEIICDTPNKDLYRFEGLLKLPGADAIPLSIENVLLRGASLRNTEYVFGIVLYAGSQTKV